MKQTVFFSQGDIMKNYCAYLIITILMITAAACGAAEEIIETDQAAENPPTETIVTRTISPTWTSEPPTSTNTAVTETATPTVITPSPTQDMPAPTATIMVKEKELLAEKGYLPRFEPGPCQFSEPHGFEIECGYLVVPEDRSQPEGNQVRMHVAIFKSRSESPAPDPVIYLTGGGGGNELDRTIRYLDDGNEALLDRGDFIMYNQRGVKYNTPHLECEGYEDYMLDVYTSDLTREEEERRQLAYYKNCHDELVEMGIDLNMYNTTVNAADLNDLRIALGYDEINIYGTSYGTHLALFALRDYGEHIRSAIIDSVYPSNVHYFSTFGTNANNTFQKIFAACEEDEYCSRQYPDLEETFYKVTRQLNENPRTMDAPDNAGVIRYNGNDFVAAMYMLPYISHPELLPLFVYQASEGDYSNVENFVLYTMDIGVGDVISEGVHNSILCKEEIAYDSYENLAAMGALLPPEVAEAYDTSYMFDLCEFWEVDPTDPSQREAVVSDVPTLILNGEFDPITPSEWGWLAGETLSNSYYYIFPGHGHGVMRSVQCGFQIGLQFLNDPYTEPDASCINDMPGIEFE